MVCNFFISNNENYFNIGLQTSNNSFQKNNCLYYRNLQLLMGTVRLVSLWCLLFVALPVICEAASEETKAPSVSTPFAKISSQNITFLSGTKNSQDTSPWAGRGLYGIHPPKLAFFNLLC